MQHDDIEQVLGYVFRNKDLKKSALTHPSAGQTDFEMLEFLGDRLLGLAIAHTCYIGKTRRNVEPTQDQGKRRDDAGDLNINNIKNCLKLSGFKLAKLVSTQCLVVIAKQWHIEDHLKHKICELSPNVLADAVEALLGAVYLDAGYEAARNIVEKWWNQFAGMDIIEPKTRLQELAQSKKLGLPVYTTISTTGSGHVPLYKVSVRVIELGEALGEGCSKHVASKRAAIALLSKLGLDDVKI